jgi:hypothetical protein
MPTLHSIAQEVSPHVEIMPLLLEHRARNGLGKDETERLNSILEAVSAAITNLTFAVEACRAS